MATIGTALTTLQQQPLLPLPAQSAALASQENATPTQGVTQNADTVTLTGRTAESQQTNEQNGGSQAGGATTFFFAEQQMFLAANGSAAGPTGAQAPDVPQLPVKISEEGLTAAQTQGSAPSARAAATQQSAAAGTPATAAGNQFTSTADAAQVTMVGANAGGAISGNAPAGTPLAELAQLDNTLQEIGINPQSISVFNRMAILLYANDPAALRILVKTLQNGTAAAANGSANTLASAATPTNANNSSQLPPSQAQQSAPQTQVQGAGTQIELLLQQTDQNPALASDTANQNSTPAQTSAASTNSGAANTAQVTSQSPQPTADSLRFVDLQSMFAAVGLSQLASSQQSQSAGQFLNVTA
jgi:hypothetical protein